MSDAVTKSMRTKLAKLLKAARKVAPRKHSRYTGELLRALRAVRGVGPVRRLRMEG